MAQQPLTGTRRRILESLRRRANTPANIADELDVTPNTVQRHLKTLESEGWVRTVGRGVWEPTQKGFGEDSGLDIDAARGNVQRALVALDDDELDVAELYLEQALAQLAGECVPAAAVRDLADEWRIPSPTVESEEIITRNSHARELRELVGGE